MSLIILSSLLGILFVMLLVHAIVSGVQNGPYLRSSLLSGLCLVAAVLPWVLLYVID